MSRPQPGQVCSQVGIDSYWHLRNKSDQASAREYSCCLHLIFDDYTRHDAEISVERYLKEYHYDAENWKDNFYLVKIDIKDSVDQEELEEEE